MIHIASLLEYFLGMRNQYKRDECIEYYYTQRINLCKELLNLGIEYTTFEQLEAIHENYA